MCVSSSFCFSLSGWTANHFVTLARKAQGSWKKPSHPRFKPIICKSCPSQRVEIFASVTNEDSSWGPNRDLGTVFKKEKKQSSCFCQWMWMWLVHVRPQTVSSCSEHERGRERTLLCGGGHVEKKTLTSTDAETATACAADGESAERAECSGSMSRITFCWNVNIYHSVPYDGNAVYHIKLLFLSFKKYFLNLEWSESYNLKDNWICVEAARIGSVLKTMIDEHPSIESNKTIYRKSAIKEETHHPQSVQ